MISKNRDVQLVGATCQPRHSRKKVLRKTAKGLFVSSPERPETVPRLELLDTLHWSGNNPGRSKPGTPNQTGLEGHWNKMWSEVSCLSQIKYALNFFAEKRIVSDIYALKLLQHLEESSYFSFPPQSPSWLELYVGAWLWDTACVRSYRLCMTTGNGREATTGRATSRPPIQLDGRWNPGKKTSYSGTLRWSHW